MYFDVIQHPDQLSAYRHQWNRFEIQSPYQSYEWIEGWSRGIDSETTELCFVVWHEENGDWLGLAPFCLEFGLGRKLCLLQPGGESGHDRFLLAVPGQYENFVKALSNWLSNSDACRQLIGSIDAIVLDKICRHDPAVKNLLEQFTNAQYRIHYNDPFCKWTLSLPNTLQAFIDGLPPSLGAQCEDWIEFTDECITTRSSNDAGIVGLWNAFEKMRVGIEPPLNDCFANDEYIHCLRKTIFRLHNESVAEIKINYLGESPVSGLILLTSNGRQYVCETAVSPFANLTGIAEWTVLRAIRDAISNGCTSMEFSAGEAAHKSIWNSESISLCQARLIPPKLLSRIKYGIMASSEALFGSR